MGVICTKTNNYNSTFTILKTNILIIFILAEIFDNEVDNPNDLRLDNELEEGEEDYYDDYYGDENLPDLQKKLDRIAGASDTYNVAGTVRLLINHV